MTTESRYMLCIFEHTEDSMTSHLWPISAEFAARIRQDLGPPASEALVTAEAAHNLHERSHAEGVIYLDQDQSP